MTTQTDPRADALERGLGFSTAQAEWLAHHLRNALQVVASLRPLGSLDDETLFSEGLARIREVAETAEEFARDRPGELAAFEAAAEVAGVNLDWLWVERCEAIRFAGGADLERPVFRVAVLVGLLRDRPRETRTLHYSAPTLAQAVEQMRAALPDYLAKWLRAPA